MFLQAITVMKRLLATLLLALSPLASAEWVTATGSAPIPDGKVFEARDAAVKDAIRQALLQSGASVTTSTEVKNGKLGKERVKIESSSSVKRYRIISQEEKDGELFVTIKADIIEKAGQCVGTRRAKSITVMRFKYDQGQGQLSSRGLDDFNRELSRQFHSVFLNAKENFRAMPWLDQSYAIDLRSESSPDRNTREQILRLAQVTDSQYLMFGTIRDLGFTPQDGWFADDKRALSFSVYLVNGLTGETEFARNYSGSADWQFKPEDFVDVKSARFWDSKYGKLAESLIRQAAVDAANQLKCAPVEARIIRARDGGFEINAGARNGIKQGDRFTVLLENSYRDDRGDIRVSNAESSTVLVAERVYDDTATLKPEGKRQSDTAISRGDIVKAQ